MNAFDHIAIVYNPESTGDAPKLAEDLAADIDENLTTIGVKATLTPTKHARHAIELAYDIATSHARPLIISVSGDGGYNEIVNGAMRAKIKHSASNPVVAVVGAGNANDHRRVMRDEPLIDMIKRADIQSFDLLRLSATAKDFQLERFAHSYIGFGVTPTVGNELNKVEKSRLTEIKSILKSYRLYAPFRVKRDGKIRLLDNLLFANINEMAKVIKLDEENTAQDGRFEVIELLHRSKFHMVGTLVKAAVIGFKNPPSYSTYTLTCLDALPIQLDGEIEKIPADCQVTITSSHRAIDSLIS